MAKEKLWLRCVNLGDNPNEAEIEKFLDSITTIDLNIDFFLGFDFSPADDWETPTIDNYKQFHKEFMSIFHHRMETKRLHDSEEAWLNEYSLTCRSILKSYQWSTDDPIDEIAFNWRHKVVFGLAIQPIQNYVVFQFNRFLESGQELRQCAAEDCNLLFIPKLKNQIYHSDRCRKRIWARKNKN